MKFSATLRGVTFDDPKEFAAAVKAAPLTELKRRGGRGPQRAEKIPVKIKTGIQKDLQSGANSTPSRVTLTAAEKDWLGATVRGSDGAVGQVWALAPINGYVWVVADGETWFGAIHTSALEMVESRVDQLALGV